MRTRLGSVSAEGLVERVEAVEGPVGWSKVWVPSAMASASMTSVGGIGACGDELGAGAAVDGGVSNGFRGRDR